MAEENKMKVEKEIKEEKVEEKVGEKVESKEVKKVAKKAEVVKRDVAIANGFSMKISPKQCKYVCRVILGKSPEMAVARLQAVIDEKRPVPMAALEAGHRKGKGLAGARYPKNACKGVMEIVKQASANAVVAGIENPVISIAKSDQASAPYRKAGRKAKRAHIHVEIRNKVKMMEDKKKKSGGKK
jgi:ribosomal protein L22